MPSSAASRTVPPLSEFCADIRLSKDARALINDALSPLDFVRLLIERAKLSDAIHVVSHLFAKREAVWWACQCIRQTMKGELPRAEAEALAAVETWVANPGEQTRSGLMNFAMSVGMDKPAGCVAMAAFGSEGSMVPPEYPPMYPEPTLTAELSAASILMAGAVDDPERCLDHYKLYLEQGLGLYENRGA